MEEETVHEGESHTGLYIVVGIVAFLAFAALVLAVTALLSASYGLITVNTIDPSTYLAPDSATGRVTIDNTVYNGVLNFARVAGSTVSPTASVNVSGWQLDGNKTLRIINQGVTSTSAGTPSSNAYLVVTGFARGPTVASSKSVTNVYLMPGEYIDLKATGAKSAPNFIGLSSTSQVGYCVTDPSSCIPASL